MLAAVGNLPHNANCYQVRKASIQESGGVAEATGLRAVPIFRQVVIAKVFKGASRGCAFGTVTHMSINYNSRVERGD